MSDCCKTCRFFKVLHGVKVTSQGTEMSEDVGKCVRRSPVVSDRTNGKWPTVFSDEWCGEFTRRGTSGIRYVPND